MKKLTRDECDAILAQLLWRNPTYGQLELLAGVVDRHGFWHGKTEQEGRAELREMIRRRILNGELAAVGPTT